MNRKIQIGTRLLASIWVVILLAACHENINKKLLAADEYLNREQVDSAYHILKYINPEELDGNENMALYTLLNSKAKYLKYIPIKNDSIDYAIFYYEQHGPADRLADAYNYKGMILYYEQKSYKKAIECLKKAETIAANNKLRKQEQRIAENLCIVNKWCNHDKMALDYGLKALYLARKMKDNLGIAYDICYVANSYSALGMGNKALEYNLKAITYLKYYSKTNQSILFGNIAGYYLDQENARMADVYLQKAFQKNPTIITFSMAADIYIKKGLYHKAKEIMGKAPLPINNIEKAKKLSTLFNLYKQSGDLAQALCVADSIFVLHQQKEDEAKKYDNLSEIQAKYDREMAEQKFESRLIYLACILVLFTFLIVLLIYRQRNKSTKMKQMMMQNQLVKNDYIQKIADMEKSQGAYTEEIADMREKIKSLEGKVAEETSMGKICYDHVLMNGSIAKWKDNDFNDFIDYYRLIDISYVVSLEEGYRKLTPYQTFFMILDNKMNKNEAQLEQILGISYSSIRSMKSRINLKRNTSISSKE